LNEYGVPYQRVLCDRLHTTAGMVSLALEKAGPRLSADEETALELMIPKLAEVFAGMSTNRMMKIQDRKMLVAITRLTRKRDRDTNFVRERFGISYMTLRKYELELADTPTYFLAPGYFPEPDISKSPPSHRDVKNKSDAPSPEHPESLESMRTQVRELTELVQKLLKQHDEMIEVLAHRAETGAQIRNLMVLQKEAGGYVASIDVTIKGRHIRTRTPVLLIERNGIPKKKNEA